MFCIEEITNVLRQSTNDSWGSCKSFHFLHEQESIKAYRWIHQKTKMGFVLAVGSRNTPLDEELLRVRIRFFRQWIGTNLGLLYLLPGGMEKGADKALPFYGYLRSAILDFAEERLYFGSDSSRFHTLIGAIAHLLGIPCGAASRAQIALQFCNVLGPSSWTQAHLFAYQQKGVLGWHPLYLASVFPELTLALDGTIHDEEHVVLLFPESFPLCSFPIQEARRRFRKKKIIVLYAHSCTEKTLRCAQQNNILLCPVTTDPVSVFIELGWRYIPIPPLEFGTWSPYIWDTYLRIISFVSKSYVDDCALIIDDSIAYISSLTISGVESVLARLPKHMYLVIQSNFAIPKHLFADYTGYVWMYREEILRGFHLPVALESAFLHFHSFPTNFIHVPSWQERFFQRGTRYFDRFRGTEVTILQNIPPHHSELQLGFLLSMHRGSIPFLLYDRSAQILVVGAHSKSEKISNYNTLPLIAHLHRSLSLLGLNIEEWGVLYNGPEGVQMSLIEEQEKKI